MERNDLPKPLQSRGCVEEGVWRGGILRNDTYKRSVRSMSGRVVVGRLAVHGWYINGT